MVKYIVVVAVALIAIQGALAKPKGQKAQKAEEKSQLEELAQNAQQVVNNVTNYLEGNLPDSKKVVQVLETNAQQLADNVQSVVNKIKTEVKNNQGEIDNVLKQVSDKLSETHNQLQTALGPEGQKQAKDIKAKIDQSLKDAVAQVEKLTKAIEPEATKVKTDISNAAKTFLDQIVEVSNNLQQQVKATLEEKH